MDAAHSIKLKYLLIKIASGVNETGISSECVSPVNANFAYMVHSLTTVDIIKPS